MDVLPTWTIVVEMCVVYNNSYIFTHWLSCFSLPEAKVSLGSSVSAGPGEALGGVWGSMSLAVDRALWGTSADSADWGTLGEGSATLGTFKDRERSRMEVQILTQL